MSNEAITAQAPAQAYWFRSADGAPSIRLSDEDAQTAIAAGVIDGLYRLEVDGSGSGWFGYFIPESAIRAFPFTEPIERPDLPATISGGAGWDWL